MRKILSHFHLRFHQFLHFLFFFGILIILIQPIKGYDRMAMGCHRWKISFYIYNTFNCKLWLFSRDYRLFLNYNQSRHHPTNNISTHNASPYTPKIPNFSPSAQKYLSLRPLPAFLTYIHRVLNTSLTTTYSHSVFRYSPPLSFHTSRPPYISAHPFSPLHHTNTVS